MKHDNPQFVDYLLDATLERYSSVEPRTGLEGRILAGVAARWRSARRRNWTLALAFSALAVAAFVFAVLTPRRNPASVAPPEQVATAQPEAVIPRASFSRELPPVRNVQKPTAIPQRPRQFPTPAPLSEQEKLLLLYVQETPKSVLAEPVNTAKDLEIPDLKIAALDIKDLPRMNDEK